MNRIAITGSSGYIGMRLVAAFSARPDIERILGLDIRPPDRGGAEPFRFQRTDVRQPFSDTFIQEGIDTAIHLAFLFAPTRRPRSARSVNLDGLNHFLEACRAAKVRRAVVLGSATAYGARPDNPDRLPESAPLRATPAFPYSHEKRLADQLCSTFAADHPDIPFAVLRPPIVLGPSVDNYVSRILFKPKILCIRNDDPPMQFIHEDDLCAAIVSVLEAGETGPLNVSPDDSIRFTQLAAEFKRAPLALPAPMAKVLCTLTYALRLSSLNESPPGALAYIRYPWLVDGTRFRAATHYRFRHSTLETVRAWRQSVVNRAQQGLPIPGKIRV